MLATPARTDPTPDRDEEPQRLIEGALAPPQGAVLSALARHKLLIVLCTLVFTVVGAAIGYTRPRTYTAAATLQVGQVNPNSPGFYGYVQSATSLATAFSRAISAQPVLATVRRELGAAGGHVGSRLSAEPIPLSPAFRVIATGSSQRAAVRLANAAASAVVAYEQQSNSANPQASSLLAEYREASLRLAQENNTLATLDRARRKSATAITHAQAARNTTAIKQRALGVAYTSAVSSAAPRSGLLSLLAGATGASDNHRAKLELGAFVGFAVGILGGCFAAVALDWRRRRARRRGAAAVEPA